MGINEAQQLFREAGGTASGLHALQGPWTWASS